MGSSTFTPESYSLQKQRMTLFAVLNIGGTGAVTLQSWSPTSGQVTGAYSAASTSGANSYSPGGAQGVASVSRVSAGLYTVTLQEGYQRLLGVHPTFLVPTTAIPAAPVMGVVKPAGTGGSLGTNLNSFNVQFSTGGVATDPASGEQIILKIDVDKSGVV